MKKLEPTGNDFKIRKPGGHEWSEFEVQAWLFMSLIERGIDVRGEVTWSSRKEESFRGKRTTRCRFDLVIFDGLKPEAILEIKATPIANPRKPFLETRQPQRYMRFGVPVYFIYGMDDVNEFLKTHYAARAA